MTDCIFEAQPWLDAL